MGIIAVAVSGVGALLGWLWARHGHEAAVHAVEAELAATKAHLSGRLEALSHAHARLQECAVQEEQMTGLLTTTRAEFARAEAEARLLQMQVHETRAALTAQSTQLREAQTALAQREGELRAHQERAQEFERSRQVMRLEFEALGQKLLEDKGKAMLEHNHRSLEGLLAPVRERLKEFEDKFQKTYDLENRDRASLLEKLRQLQETERKLHDEATALSRALTGDSRAQGEWGELILESLLASAGLTEGREYELQVDHQSEEGRHRRPDALVYLPPNRAIVVDAKCSLTAYVAAARCVSPEERERQLDLHVHSLKTHVKLLAAKDYQSVVKARSLDFVFLFVPSEAAFHAAVSRAPGLLEEAMRQKVVVCSPTTVLATLQMVHHVWRSERQTLNAQRIAEEAGKMVDKLSAALESFNDVGARLGQAHSAFEVARMRLSSGKGNVASIAERVVQLGARVSKPERFAAVQRALDSESEIPLALEGQGELPSA